MHVHMECVPQAKILELVEMLMSARLPELYGSTQGRLRRAVATIGGTDGLSVQEATDVLTLTSRLIDVNSFTQVRFTDRVASGFLSQRRGCLLRRRRYRDCASTGLCRCPRRSPNSTPLAYSSPPPNPNRWPPKEERVLACPRGGGGLCVCWGEGEVCVSSVVCVWRLIPGTPCAAHTHPGGRQTHTLGCSHTPSANARRSTCC